MESDALKAASRIASQRQKSIRRTAMSDLVERAKQCAEDTEDWTADVMLHECAARIAQLEAALRRFTDEYARLQLVRRATMHDPECRCLLCAYDNARAALEERT